MNDIPNEPDHYPPPVELATRRQPATRVPPHDLAAEASLLGACLLSAAAIGNAAQAGLTATDFYRPAHAHIWQAILALHAAGEPCDPVTVADQLHRDGLLGHVGGPAELVALQVGTPAISSAPRYARIVAEHARLRRLIGVAAEIADLAYSLPDDVAAVEAKALDLVTERAHTTTSAWQPVDLANQTKIVERPWILQRVDGPALFYIGKVNSLAGPPESAKSWCALCAHAQLAKQHIHSVYIDYEDNPQSVAQRLRLLGLDDNELGYVHYYWPDQSLDGALAAIDTIGHPVDLVTIDSNTRATLAAGGKTNSTDDAAALGNTLMRIARHTGAGIILLDHVTKDDDGTSPYSRGAGDKLAYIDGAAYKVKVISQFAPGRTGKSELTCVKDRPGGARAEYLNGRTAATFTLESEGVGQPVTITIDPPQSSTTDAGDFRPTGLMEQVSRALETAGQPLNAHDIRKLVRAKKNEHKDVAARCLVDEGYVRIEPGPRNARLHVLIRPFREASELDAKGA